MSPSNTEPEAEKRQPSRYGYPPMAWDVEDLDRYRPGGLHPIIIGDTLANGRYQVVRKLGHGGYATVWLCRDMETEGWSAIKVMAAEASQEAAECLFGEMAVLKHFEDVEDEEVDANNICLAEDTFTEFGPNGKHLCLVLPVLGGNVRGVWARHGDNPDFLKDICAQLVRAMAWLHSKGVCHGDFRTANILTRIENIEEATDEEVMDMFPPSYGIEVPPIPATGEAPGPHIPEFLYTATSYQPLPGQESSTSIRIAISDFGEAYFVDNPVPSLGIPLRYAAPEVIVGEEFGFGFATDIWSLGAAICEVRQGTIPFNGDGDVDAVRCLEELLGPLPEPYRSVWIGRGYDKLCDVPSPSGIAVTEPVSTTKENLEETRQTWMDVCGYPTVLEKIIRLKRKIGIPMEEGEDLTDKPNQWDGGHGIKWIEHQTPADEAGELFDLLSRIFKYSPDERLTVAEIMAHPWFVGRFSRQDMQDMRGDVAMGEATGKDVDGVAKETVIEIVEKAVEDVGAAAEETEDEQTFRDWDQDTEMSDVNVLLITHERGQGGNRGFCDTVEEQPAATEPGHRADAGERAIWGGFFARLTGAVRGYIRRMVVSIVGTTLHSTLR